MLKFAATCMIVFGFAILTGESNDFEVKLISIAVGLWLLVCGIVIMRFSSKSVNTICNLQ